MLVARRHGLTALDFHAFSSGMPIAFDPPSRRRRRLTLAPLALCGAPLRAAAADAPADGRRWMAAAESMKQLALSWGDQPFGAVLVKHGRIVGLGPSRVVKYQDADAHAEREAIRHAIAALGPRGAQGAALYSTSRPCARCESTALAAGVTRMYFGPGLEDAGPPRAR